MISWLLEQFPGSTIEYSTTRRIAAMMETDRPTGRRKEPPMSDAQLFDTPEKAPSDRLGDYAGALCLFKPLSTKTLDTTFGASDVIIANVMVLEDSGRLVYLPETPIFWKSVKAQILPGLGRDRWIAGRLMKGAGRNEKQWTLEHVTPEEGTRLGEAMVSEDFAKLVEPF